MKIVLGDNVHLDIHLTDQMRKDFRECQARAEKVGSGKSCDGCSMNVDIYGTGLCELPVVADQLRGKSKRYTEYHAGKAVIRDKALLSEALEKLAKIENLEDITGIVCGEYCQWPERCANQEELDERCAHCKLSRLFDVLQK